jgi:hypothetical protein
MLKLASVRFASPREVVRSANYSSGPLNAFTRTRTLTLALFEMARSYDSAKKVRVC